MSQAASGPWLVVGLGNPGPAYAATRHNVGWLVADLLAERAGVPFAADRRMRAHLARTRLAGGVLGGVGADAVPVVLCKPTTFMNESGRAVHQVARFHKITADHIIAVHDELDLNPGQFRVKLGGGDNGHNGLRSLRQHLGTGDFLRVRFGIGRPAGGGSVTDWVLGTWPRSEAADVAVDLERGADVVESLLTHGLTLTQNAVNGYGGRGQ